MTLLTARPLFIAVFLVLSGCSLPRGAPLQSEILSGATATDSGFAVYAVTRDQLPIYADWPLTGNETGSLWIEHTHGARGQ
ncbi:MAG: polysaccharide export protein, partial [Halocynthiibacter sp.]